MLDKIISFFAIFVESLVLHPRSNGTVNIIVMGKVRLGVQTVPAFDPVSSEIHTAFNVILLNDEQLCCVSGWTLRDAIEIFCKRFHVEREHVYLQRPFFPQRINKYE